MKKHHITIDVTQQNGSHLRICTTLSEGGIPITSRTRTVRIPDGRRIDFELAESCEKLIKESLWFWANQMAIPGL